MKSKIYNLRNIALSPINNDFLQDYNSTYANRISSIIAMNKSFITTTTAFTQDANYPLENIDYNYSMYSFARCNNVFVPGYGQYVSGFRIIGTNGSITDGFFNFNKEGNLLASNWEGFLYIFFRHKTDNTKWFGLRYAKPASTSMLFNNPTNVSGFDVNGVFHHILDISNCISLKEGFFYFNQGHIQQLAKVRQENYAGLMTLNEFDLADYNVTIELNVNLNIKMELSNGFLGKAFEFYPNGKIDFDNQNLNKYEMSARVGKTFQQTNKRVKTVSFSLSPLTTNRLNEIQKSIITYNKDFPFYYLPYANNELTAEELDGFRYSPYTTLTELEKDFQRINLNQGGLYYFQEVDKVSNTSYNIHELLVKMKEYK